MKNQSYYPHMIFGILICSLTLAACGTSLPSTPAMAPANGSVSTATQAAPFNLAPTVPDWYSIPMTNVNTGKTFSLQDFRGKVVLIETMAEWCPGCLIQQTYSLAMRMQLNNPPDLVLVSLDVEMSEDAASLKAYADQYQFDWYVAVAPLLVARALGTEYNVEYLNPPLNPMLLIDRQGVAHQLPFGVKDIKQLQSIVASYLRSSRTGAW